MDFICYFYCMVLNIKEFHLQFRKFLQKTRIVNLYDNKVGKKQL